MHAGGVTEGHSGWNDEKDPLEVRTANKVEIVE